MKIVKRTSENFHSLTECIKIWKFLMKNFIKNNTTPRERYWISLTFELSMHEDK